MEAFTPIDLATWNRRETYSFFRTYEFPFHGFSKKLDGSKIYAYAKEHGKSFFLCMTYLFLRAQNDLPAYRQRLVDGAPVEFSQVNVVVTIALADDIYCEVRLPYRPTFAEFFDEAQRVIREVKEAGTATPVRCEASDTFFSCIPYFSFDYFASALESREVYYPSIIVGKLEDGLLPVSVAAHHAFVDGRHLALLHDKLTAFLADPAGVLDA